MRAWAIGVLFVAALGAVLWFMPGSPLVRLFPKEVEVPGATARDGSSGPSRTVKITTVLPKDAIPAILDPAFISGEEANAQLAPFSTVIGLSVNGDHRAYSTTHLNNHEAVNDTVGGVPVVVTW